MNTILRPHGRTRCGLPTLPTSGWLVGWGYYYLVTVMDDYSRFILAWKLQKDMSANSLIEVVQEAVERYQRSLK